MRALSIPFTSLLLAGCASISSVQTADTLGKKNWQVALEGGFQRAGSRYLPLYPHFDVAARYGVTDRVDVNARLGYSGLELGSKVLLTKVGTRFPVSLAPVIGGALLPRTNGVLFSGHLALPVLVGFKHAHGNELIVGARLQGRFAFVPTGAALLEAGLSLGYSLRLGAKFALIPEVAATIPLATTRDAYAVLGAPDPNIPGFFERFLVQVKVGFVFGKQRAVE